MDSGRHEWKKYVGPVREILNREWDPIGVAEDVPDEYDSYIPGVVTRLLHGKPVEELVEYLWEIETVQIGMHGDRQRAEAVARSLLRVHQELQRAS